MASLTCPPDSRSLLLEARPIVRDLLKPNPLIYWADFLFSIGIGMFFFGLVRIAPLGSPAQLACFVISCLLYHRAVTFTHELAHLPRGKFRLFRITWNLLCGIPFLMPSFMYYTHMDHHRRTHYGTDLDGRYFPFRYRPRILIVRYLLASLGVPLLVVTRFLLLAPLSWLCPPYRRWLYSRLSSLVLSSVYVRPKARPEAMRIMLLQEVACFLWCLGIIFVPPIVLHRWAIPFAIQAYCTAVFLILLNSLRTLASHRWTSEGEEMSSEDQALDSLNYPYRPWFTV